jgi:hypothetical protein
MICTSLPALNRVPLEKLPVVRTVKKFFPFSGIPKAPFRVHTTLSQDNIINPILSQTNPLHCLSSYFLKVHCNISLTLTSRTSKHPLSFKFSYQTLVSMYVLSHDSYRPASREHPNHVCTRAPHYTIFCCISSLNVQIFILDTEVSNTLVPCLPFSRRPSFSNTYKTTENSCLHLLLFTFSDIRLNVTWGGERLRNTFRHKEANAWMETGCAHSALC